MREKISVYVDELFSDAALTIRNAAVSYTHLTLPTIA